MKDPKLPMNWLAPMTMRVGSGRSTFMLLNRIRELRNHFPQNQRDTRRRQSTRPRSGTPCADCTARFNLTAFSM